MTYHLNPNTMDKKDVIKSLRSGKRKGRNEWSEEVDKNTTSKSAESQALAARLSDIKPALALSDYEKDIFDTIAVHLENNNLLATVDTIVLTMLARNIFMWKQANDNLISFDDYIQVHTNGAMSPSAAANISKQAEDMILKLSNKLGLSPADRIKMLGGLPPMPDKDAEDPLLS